MADNYLEKRMEDHRAGRDGGPRRHAVGPRPGWLTMRYPAQTVTVGGTWPEALEAVASAFVQAGCRVALVEAFFAGAEETARRVGARYYPMSRPEAVEDLRRRGQLPAVSVWCGPGKCPETDVRTRLRLALEAEELPGMLQIIGEDTVQMARMALMAAHPAASMPPGTIYC